MRDVEADFSDRFLVQDFKGGKAPCELSEIVCQLSGAADNEVSSSLTVCIGRFGHSSALDLVRGSRGELVPSGAEACPAWKINNPGPSCDEDCYLVEKGFRVWGGISQGIEGVRR